ncbi:ABC transporter substrate-binding protein [Bradyrhizobium sp. Pear76]|uniref:ABC transporter substrate-binding protein n=1 Tax=Bradyrhizobium oropedii TaxID=1571201 RepID=UPI001E4930D8|nr:ABC transporter substrate-binding protein [Bradyrhizobium oropedii]MCC8965617.1 ABC transporter substrate-binding protein [Bradyrhizobium oropedii]
MRDPDRRQILFATVAVSASSLISAERLLAADLPKVGLVHPGPKGPIPSISAVVAGMAVLGHEDGRTVALEYRFAEGKLDQLPLIVRDLIELDVKVIVAVAGEALVAAARITNTVPIVSATAGGDFVSMGLIKSWDRPGTNVTGMNLIADEAAAARVEIVRKILPVARTLAVLVNPYPGNDELLSAMRAASSKANIKLVTLEIGKVDDLEPAIVDAKRNGADAVTSLQGPFFFFQRKLLADLSLKHKIPLAMSEALAAEAGALLQVNPDVPGCAERSANFVDLILKGANPRDLGIERYSRYDVVFNLRTARELGISLSPDTIKGSKVIE